jgi:GTP cyclohydrolase II
MPDILHYFGVKKIHNLHSMSNMKYDAIVGSGIEVVNRISIPPELVPADAQVEIEAKKAAGYFTDGKVRTEEELQAVQGRELEE